MGQEGKEPGKRPPLRSRLWAWTGFADKTLWEWLQLLGALAIPLVLAIAGFWFTSQQEARQRKIENLRTKSEQQIEELRADDAALQAYLDQMSDLLLAKDGLRESEEGSEVRTLARARTITVLERLDPSRKTAVMQFLVEAELVQGVGERAPEESFDPTIEPRGANLSGAGAEPAQRALAQRDEGPLQLGVEQRAPILTLSGADLHGVNLSSADLSGADLSGASLSAASLNFASLIGADLNGANLSDAQIGWASLSAADLSAADLDRANLILSSLRCANLKEADLRGADLGNASLNDADLTSANLNGADLNSANLNNADLSYVQLSDVDLTKEQRQEANTDTQDSAEEGLFPPPRECERTEPSFHP